MNAPAPVTAQGELRTSLFNVPGIHCAGCISRIERGLAQAEGVHTARVNFTAKRVRIEHEDAIGEEHIQSELRRLGFPAEPFAGDAEPPATREGQRLLRALGVAGFAHKKIERNVTLLAILSFIAVAIGGIVEIAPLFWIDSTLEKVEGVRPYTPLEQAGRDIYVREGCYSCHSQMIRPFRDEVERYGHYSLAAESMYDHPFQWGSKRTGPDLARVGGRYSDEWHVQHMINPRSVVPESIMPPYAFLAERNLTTKNYYRNLRALNRVGVPYTEDQITNAEADMLAQGSAEGDTAELFARYGQVQARDFDGNPGRLTEMDALVAYLQMLGTLVDFDAAAPREQPR